MLALIKSKYILAEVFEFLMIKYRLKLINRSKKIQNRLNLNIKDYKEYCEIYSSIVIEVIPAKNIYSKFIKINENPIKPC